MRFDNHPAHPSRIRYVLVSLLSWPFLVGLFGPAANSSAGSPAAENGTPGGTEIGGSKQCQIEFRTKANTLDEDAWVVFSISSMHITPTVAAFRYRLKDLDDSRIAPGERLIATTSRKVSCDREWRFYIDVRMGSPLSFLATKDVRIDLVVDQRGSDQDEVIVELGSPACWAAHADGFLGEEDLLAGCETGEEDPIQVTGPIRISNFRSGPICDAGAAEIGRPPSDRICEARDVPVRGKDTCVYNEKEVRCTWWGFEFDYENADPNEPITCIWTRDRAMNEGNYEGIRKTAIATDTVSFKVEETRGHYVSYMYDNYMWNAPPWLTVEAEYLCEYRGEPLFTATYRMIHTSAFR